MEATTDQVKFDLIEIVFTLPDRLGVDDANVIVFYRYCKRLLVAVESHTKDLVALGCRRLPSGLKVVGVLA